ncbi:MAG: SDR family oxidoreductase [Sphingomonas fennica]
MTGMPPLALVTGGTRRLGAAIARRLAERGMALALHVHTARHVDDPLLATLKEEQIDWETFVADLSDEAAVAGLVPGVTRRFGRAPDILVNCASLFTDDDAESATMARYVDHFRINVAAPAVLAQALAAAARAEGRVAAIVNILDQRIARPHGDQLSYTASKMALAEATRLLAVALAPHARVNGVAPGLTIETPAYSRGQMRRLAEAMPLGRLPTPDDVADAVLWAIDARAASGQIVYVDGGAALRSWPRDFVHLARD